MNLDGKKVIVTGADGFIGSHLVEALLAEGCRVKALLAYNSFNSWGWLDSFPGHTLQAIEKVQGDVRDPQSMMHALGGCDIVCHLAALIGIPYSYRAPDSYVDTNIKGTLNVLQAARALELERVLVASTSEVYGTAQYVPVDESHPMQGQSPYSATKIGADRLAEAFHRSYGVPVTIVRPFNTYGPRQSARAVIPTVITQLLAGATTVRLGSLTPTRDFVYVKDTVQGFVELARSTRAIGEEVNIATNVETSIDAVARLLIEAIKPLAAITCDEQRLRPEASEVERLVGSNEKLVELTDWRSRYDLRTGLAETIEWFKDPENLKGYRPGAYST